MSLVFPEARWASHGRCENRVGCASFGRQNIASVFSFHDLRHHLRVTRLVQAGVDLNTVRELLGHADLKMALRYAHLAPEHTAAAVAKLVKA